MLTDHSMVAERVALRIRIILFSKTDSQNRFTVKTDSQNGFAVKTDSQNGFAVKTDSQNGFAVKTDSQNGFAVENGFAKWIRKIDY